MAYPKWLIEKMAKEAKATKEPEPEAPELTPEPEPEAPAEPEPETPGEEKRGG